MAKKLFKVCFTERPNLLKVLEGTESFYTVPKTEENTQAFSVKQAIFNVKQRDPKYQDKSKWGVVGIKTWNSNLGDWELVELRRPGDPWEEASGLVSLPKGER
jgi:hypothetical protein